MRTRISWKIESLDIFYIWQSLFIRLTKNHSAPISAHHTSWKMDATYPFSGYYTFTLNLCRLMWRKDFLRRLLIQRSEQHLNKIDYLVLIFDNTAKTFFNSFCSIILFRNSNKGGKRFVTCAEDVNIIFFSDWDKFLYNIWKIMCNFIVNWEGRKFGCDNMFLIQGKRLFACISSIFHILYRNLSQFEKKNNIYILCTCHSRRWIFMTI